MSWLPIPLTVLKYLVVGLLCGSFFFYGHHKGFKEADTEWQLKQKTYLEESLKKQKEQQELNNKLQKEIEEQRLNQEATYKKQLQQISELKRLNVLDKKECQLNQNQVEQVNKIFRGLQ